MPAELLAADTTLEKHGQPNLAPRPLTVARRRLLFSVVAARKTIMAQVATYLAQVILAATAAASASHPLLRCWSLAALVPLCRLLRCVLSRLSQNRMGEVDRDLNAAGCDRRSATRPPPSNRSAQGDQTHEAGGSVRVRRPRVPLQTARSPALPRWRATWPSARAASGVGTHKVSLLLQHAKISHFLSLF